MKYEIDKSYLPKVVIVLDNKSGKRFLDCETGIISDEYIGYGEIESRYYKPRVVHSRDVSTVFAVRGSSLKKMYVKYHDENDTLELGVLKFNTNKNGEHDWTFDGDNLFLNKSKEFTNENGDVILSKNSSSCNAVVAGNWCRKSIDFIRVCSRYNYYITPYIIEELKKFLGDSFVIGNGSVVEVKYLHSLEKWISTSQRQVGKGKQSKLLDELLSHELSEVNTSILNYVNYNDAVFYEKINKDWSVLRNFNIRSIREHHEFKKNIVENRRIYISKNELRPAGFSKGEWVLCNSNAFDCWRQQYFMNPKDAIENCDRIRYVASVFENFDGRIGFNLLSLYNIMRFPHLEQIAKMGSKEFVKSISRSKTVNADLKRAFWNYNPKSKSIVKSTGLSNSKFVMYLKCLDSRYGATSSYNLRAFKELVNYLGVETINSYSDDVFENKLKAYSEFVRINYLTTIGDSTPLDTIERMYNKGLIRMYAETMNNYSYLDIVRRNMCDGIDFNFKCESDLLRAHDIIVNLYNEQQAERRAMWDMQEAERRKKDQECLEKTDAERKIYEYSDDKFEIRLPKDVAEIITEGSTQRICIGGYTYNHSHGLTNLFFLRDKNEPDKPFYAIEMNNDKSIVQIHGFGNKWIGNNPEAIPTVIRWLRKHDIKCAANILRESSSGYSSRGQYIDLPIVDGIAYVA